MCGGGEGTRVKGDSLAYCGTPEAAFLVVLCITFTTQMAERYWSEESILSFNWPSLKAYVTRVERRAHVRPMTNRSPEQNLSSSSGQAELVAQLFFKKPRRFSGGGWGPELPGSCWLYTADRSLASLPPGRHLAEHHGSQVRIWPVSLLGVTWSRILIALR
jgi:hypothetical protein